MLVPYISRYVSGTPAFSAMALIGCGFVAWAISMSLNTWGPPFSSSVRFPAFYWFFGP